MNLYQQAQMYLNVCGWYGDGSLRIWIQENTSLEEVYVMHTPEHLPEIL
jgi:hypothetical protein